MAAAKVWTTASICEAVTARYNLQNINQLAHKFGVTFNSARNWSRGGTLDVDAIRTAALLLDEDPEWIAFCLAPERIRDASLAEKMRARLSEWMLTHGNRAAVIVLAIVAGISTIPPASQALTFTVGVGDSVSSNADSAGSSALGLTLCGASLCILC